MTTMMRTYPHLPLLTIAQCMKVFSSVHIPPTVIASLSGFTRMQIYRWSRGRYIKPHASTLELVSVLAYKVLRAIRDKRIPEKGAPNHLVAWAYAINDYTYPVTMSDLQPEDLLPRSWLAGINLVPREENAAS